MQLTGMGPAKGNNFVTFTNKPGFALHVKMQDANQDCSQFRRHYLYDSRLHFPGICEHNVADTRSCAERAAASHSAGSGERSFARATDPSRLESGIRDWRPDRQLYVASQYDVRFHYYHRLRFHRYGVRPDHSNSYSG